MIYDAENFFMNKKDLATGTTSDVIFNGGGSAYNALWLYAQVDKVLSADAIITLKTSDTEDMAGAVELATLKVTKAGGSQASMKLPQGCLKYLQLEVTGATTGTLTAALVLDVDMH